MPGQVPQTQRERDDLSRIDREFMRDLMRQVLSESLDVRDAKLIKHFDEQLEEIKKTVLSGFPESDPAGHKAYHLEQIEYMKDKRALWKDVRNKSIGGLVWLLLVLMGTALWNHFRIKMGLPPTP